MAQRKKAADDAGRTGDEETVGRNVQAIEFKPDQWEAVSKAAYQEGVPVGTWIRSAALARARELGFWNPFAQPEKKKDSA